MSLKSISGLSVIVQTVGDKICYAVINDNLMHQELQKNWNILKKTNPESLWTYWWLVIIWRCYSTLKCKHMAKCYWWQTCNFKVVGSNSSRYGIPSHFYTLPTQLINERESPEYFLGILGQTCVSSRCKSYPYILHATEIGMMSLYWLGAAFSDRLGY